MESCFWPLTGGTWRERLLAAAILFELLVIWVTYYLLAWIMQH